MGEITLKIITPNGAFGPYSCDSVHLNLCDNQANSGGGSYGIRKGHETAVLALKDGIIKGFLGGKIVVCGNSSNGFAAVEKNTVTVAVKSFEIGKDSEK